MSKYTCHFVQAEKGELPKQVLIGPRDREKWRCGVVFRGEVQQRLTMQDRADIAAFIARVVNDRFDKMNGKRILIPGHERN